MRVVFMGTPDFAAVSLKALIDGGFDVVSVFSQPDKPRDRGMQTRFSPVKEVAVQHGIEVFQPQSTREPEAIDALRRLAPDVLAVVAYGQLLPDDALSIPPLGAVNIHASLLPKYRGAAPIQWSVLNGDEVTGVTSMYIAHELDAGDIIFTEKTAIGEYETAGELFDRLADMGAGLLVKTLKSIEAGTAPRKAQDSAAATWVRQLDKTICPIDWNKSPREVVKHICGLSPWPVAITELGGQTLKIFSARLTDAYTDKKPGDVVATGKQGIEVACANGGTILITELQASGKRRMRACDWILGHPLQIS